VAQPLGAVTRQEVADRRLVQRGDLQVQVGQVTAPVVDEELAVEAVVERTELDLTRKRGEGPTELLRRVRELRDKRSVRHYRTQLRLTVGEESDSQLARAELTAAADGIADELASNRDELAWAHRLVVEILPEAIGTGLGAAGGFLAGGPVGAAVGGAAGVAAKELTRPIQNRLWGWVFEQLPFVSATKLLRRATAAEKELGAGLEKDLRHIWEQSRRDAS
jgi:hypothetical protein